MARIIDIKARQILDSRGNPTVEVDLILDDGAIGRAAVPSGASTGEREALELRDQNQQRYQGKGVLTAINNIHTDIKTALLDLEAHQQKEIDQRMIELDGTQNKERLGANAILAVSLAAAKAAAVSNSQHLFEYLHKLSATNQPPTLPLPMMNVINGGQHANFSTDIQEFMIIPVGARTFSDAVQMGAEIFHTLKKVLKEKGYQTTVGDEGGFAPKVIHGNIEALRLLSEAVEQSGYSLGTDIVFGLDVAASEFYQDDVYHLRADGDTLTSKQLIDKLDNLTHEFPILSIEDGIAQNDWAGWQQLTQSLGKKIQIVGDDLLVTNKTYLDRAIKEHSANAILIKPNQIGTLTETIEAVTMAQQAGWNTIISHRSGETEDTTIADLAVALASGQIKTGSLSRTDRTSKYNQLLRIEEYLGAKAVFASDALHT